MRTAFEFLNGWADRVFVISLTRAHDRRARVSERLRGLRFEFAEGVDKLELDREGLIRDGVLDENRSPRAFRHKREMSLGEVGAALAHRRVYARTVEAGWRRVVIFEDDVVPRAPDLERLPDVLPQLPERFDLCYLGYEGGERASLWDRAKQATYVFLGPLGLAPWSAAQALRLHASAFSANLRTAGLHMCAHAYAISLEGARKLVATQTPLAFRADWLFPYLVLNGRLRAYVTEPKLFDQESPAAIPAGVPTSYIHG